MLKYHKYFYTLSLSLVIASIASLLFFGLRFGIDFKGGSLMEIEFREFQNATSTFSLPTHTIVQRALSEFGLGEVVIQNVGMGGLLLRFAEVDEAIHQSILSKLKGFGELEELRFESVGPVIGEETKRKSLWAVSLVVILILAYVAWAFRKISFPLPSWNYGIVAVVALLHDIIITVGIFSLIGHFLKLEIGVPFIAALLTILGYSVNDTIVIFDRIRENVTRAASSFDFGKIIDKSVQETYIRSLNTSLTTLFALAAVYLFGGSTIQYFILVLIIGIIIGTYSSIFIASPLLFSLAMLKNRRRRR